MSDSAADAGIGASGTGATGTVPATGTAGAPAGDSQQAGGLNGGQPEGGEDDLQTQLAHWKSLARKHEQRAKDNSKAADRLKELEDASKTELQLAQDAKAEAERERDEARFMHSRVMAAAANNLPVELIEHLGSGTEEEINDRAALFAQIIEDTAQAIAEQLVAQMQQDGNRNGFLPQQLPGARPVESLRPGAAPAGATPTSNEQWFRNLLNRT